MTCDRCKDYGIIVTHRLVRGMSGERMMREPSPCSCEHGARAMLKYEQNLKEGRAGMHGLYPQQTLGA